MTVKYKLHTLRRNKMKTRTHLIILYTLEKAVLYFFLVASLFCLVIHFITGSVQTLPIFLILAALTFSGYISFLFCF